MGSVAYGVSTATSDIDIYGVCIPPKQDIFPHLKGEIEGFGRQKQRFEQFQQHHVNDEDAGKEYDFTIYSIVKFFTLAMENNPNIIDALFVPQYCVLHSTAIGNMIRENRRIFLHKGSYHKLKGYAYSQHHKMTTEKPIGKRVELHEKYGYDVKFAMHLVRLLNQAEQILMTGDLDLQQNNEQLKAIRRGEWKMEDVSKWFSNKESTLEKLYLESTIPHSPDEAKIKELLISCLEHHYGSISDAIVQPDRAMDFLRKLKDQLNTFPNL